MMIVELFSDNYINIYPTLDHRQCLSGRCQQLDVNGWLMMIYYSIISYCNDRSCHQPAPINDDVIVCYKEFPGYDGKLHICFLRKGC